jgi:hypothetical protein
MEKRNNWFKNYQEIPGISDGMRKISDRTQHFDTLEFEGKTVLDLGCNVGQMSFWAHEAGASQVTGIEFDLMAFAKAMEYRDKLGIDPERVRFKLDDLDLPTAWHNLTTHDIVMLLSVIDTKELVNRFGILARACMKTREIMYLEGHLKQPPVKYMNMLLSYTDFTSIRCVGRAAGRDLFRCTREVLDAEGFHRELARAMTKYRRIGVVGNQLAGKSTLRSQLADIPSGWKVLDDCKDLKKLGESSPLLLFDYRAALYCDDFDVVFNLLTPDSKFETKRPQLSFLRSSQLKTPTQLQELHTVLTHT